ncbi:MAG: Flp pilus assembly complex ATPase component TadA, partial [Proteobacteria bacterium]|nr:Flp pilus assembly complex ATPase component TadA [Pseudomonadota bacterium]
MTDVPADVPAVEPQAGELRIRYRVDGLLRDVMTVPSNASSAAVSRIKIISGLDIAERRRPQDGRATFTVDDSTVDARVSTLPTLHGEKVVVRLLPRADAVPVLSATGLSLSQLETVTTTLNQTQGLVLITGPTGSGKTNTLYAGIQQVSTPDRNIVTLEDPVEVQVSGITQVQVHERSGLTFARGLRSVLRQDPDIVVIGEMRDPETISAALEITDSGHKVFS